MRFTTGAVVLGLAVSFCIAAPLSISGIVTDSSSGAAISGAAVSLVHCGLATTTSASGAFTLSRVTAVIGRGYQATTSAAPIMSVQGEIQLSLQGAARVAVKTYSVEGKQIGSIERTLGAGNHSIMPARANSGVFLYQVVVNGRAYSLQRANVEGRAHTRASANGSSSSSCQGQAKSAAGLAALFPDTIVVSKSGYVTKQVIVTDSIVSGLAIKLRTSTVAYGSRVPLAQPARSLGEAKPAGFTQINPTDNMNTIISWHSGNYWLAPGTHTVTGDIVCLSNTVIAGGPGAIIDGGGQNAGIKLGDVNNPAHNLTIRNVIIQNYGGTDQGGVVVSYESDSLGGLLIEDVEFRNNYAFGAFMGKNSVCRRVWAHDNGEGGIKAWAANWKSTDTVLVEDCELSHNNLRLTTIGEAGGFKAVWAYNITFRRNYTHDNINSPGFWVDYCGPNNLIEDCTLADGVKQTSDGVQAVIIEMTPNCEISYCTISAPDSYTTQADGFGAALYSYNGENLSVHNCLIHGNMLGFAKYRGSIPDFPTQEVRLIGMKIMNNDMTVPAGAHVGIKIDYNAEQSDIPPAASWSISPPSDPLPISWGVSIYDTASNTWDQNVYHGSPIFDWAWAPYYDGNGTYGSSFATWQNHGQDVHSTLVP